ncbi:MAG: TIGR04190 family B12-binding domain/radical SAM domain protein, partial [Deltaproteobacteria bacterium]
MKKQDDLILIHAPSIYDFRKLPIMHGPISDVVPSTPIFEMYPIGFTSLSEYLERKGFQVRIINVAMKMIKDPAFDAEALIRKLNPRAFGFDLHWMPHVQGSLALAEMAKRLHPETPVLFGGLSSTYFHEDLVQNYPFIDYVIRGDSTEGPMAMLLAAIRAKEPPRDVPNVTWRENGEMRVNPLSYVPETMDHIAIDYGHIMKKVVKYRDMTGYVPFTNWLEYPVTAVFTCRGCSYNCRTCGGSAYGFARYANRKKPAFRAPELLAEDIFRVCDHLNAPVMIIGDIYQAGDDYGERLLS